ncbi:hypothetical protein SELR_pSRC300870 (plasmid) [Selenomonas ruminantium subsp. lactilytica TAM6421]|uniref:Uncharacterized protein n=1 Tax=Selenomonas ruminantium subsp. lactilytica (strain NBRC 103574 / TAM6421) TaxID=927704 RepID=I0GWM3_SELRL|nr:hypothetical protein [Selenomonas ruminantium]BAL85160.1 hypothetical protein SELR_pSRC300870 [Selenomonas ruminantium subsp. lactilytica TAM6421]
MITVRAAGIQRYIKGIGPESKNEDVSIRMSYEEAKLFKEFLFAVECDDATDDEIEVAEAIANMLDEVTD